MPLSKTSSAMQITRDELYQRVWQSPMTTLAKEFDISDVGLAKACRKNAIPTPPVGYWAKVAHGKKVSRIALPKGANVIIVLEAAAHRIPAPEDTPSAAPSAVVVPVKSDTQDLSPVAGATYAVLTKAKPDQFGFVRSGSSTAFVCAVSASTVDRAARLLDAIERVMPALDIKLIRDREGKKIAVEAAGERLSFTLTEEYSRKEHLVKESPGSWNRKEFTYSFSGSLKLSVESDYQGRKTWSDGVRGRLEDKLGSFLSGLVDAARATRARREEREEQRRKWEEQSRLNQIAQEHARRRKAFQENFATEAAAWSRYEQSRAYLDHLLTRSADAEQLCSAGAEWLGLAKELVERMDPSTKRLERLREGVALTGYWAPFGEPIVAATPSPWLHG